MKKLFIITALVLISCGNNSPSACDCAEMTKERIDGKIELLTKSPEEQQEINKNWEEKQAPCEAKIKADPVFEEEMGNCLISLIQVDNNEVLEDNSSE